VFPGRFLRQALLLPIGADCNVASLCFLLFVAMMSDKIAGILQKYFFFFKKKIQVVTAFFFFGIYK
jgi:hypothetical protein